MPGSLREILDAEISVPGLLKDTLRLRDLESALRKLPGLQGFAAYHDKLMLHYEPVAVTKAELIAEIRKAGFEVGETELGSASPVSDAFEEELFGEGKPAITPIP